MFSASSSLRQSSVTGACICRTPSLLDTLKLVTSMPRNVPACMIGVAVEQAQYMAGQDQAVVISSL